MWVGVLAVAFQTDPSEPTRVVVINSGFLCTLLVSHAFVILALKKVGIKVEEYLMKGVTHLVSVVTPNLHGVSLG